LNGMATVVVGGNSRNVGKTSVVTGLIAALPQMQWTAVKITPHAHIESKPACLPCELETADHAIELTALKEERDAASGTDSSRYLAAGAWKSCWMRVPPGQWPQAMPQVLRLIAEAEAHGGNVLIESNSILQSLRPTIALSVLDLAADDFKESAMRSLDRVDAVVVTESAGRAGLADAEVSRWLARKVRFASRPPVYCSQQLVEFVQARLQSASGHR
jgi:hypothetical protein